MVEFQFLKKRTHSGNIARKPEWNSFFYTFAAKELEKAF
jgi:hypothetical protein